ncbi:hypothetical protein PCANC_20499 [Puccinia coronata f. sp. avenae]|uniref:Uncharacterized protein n=1 Tax=Puccinia coronata f. sp. avenae TaxID=200324 RepID=A0A2N5SQ64_9BASI|nr:hypothetical protein PCANC_20499 [Puccinia coronata f. sp. avenae]
MHRPHLYVCMAQFERVFACLLKLYAGIDWSHNSALVQKTHTKPITSLLMMAGYIFVPPPNQEPKNAWIAKKRHAVDNLLRRQAASTRARNSSSIDRLCARRESSRLVQMPFSSAPAPLSLIRLRLNSQVTPTMTRLPATRPAPPDTQETK